MEINDRLKKFIFKKLSKDLSHIEIIPYEDSIWFIDRDKKYWYLDLERDKSLWWNYYFFNRFFQAFSLERIDYEPLIAEWVEYVLNYKVVRTSFVSSRNARMVEYVLNHKVITTRMCEWGDDPVVEDVLNNKVITTIPMLNSIFSKVEQILNSK